AKTAPMEEDSPTATEGEEWADSHEYHHESNHDDNDRDQQGAGASADEQCPNYGDGISPPNWIDVDWHVVPGRNCP
ncbi:hypothetical protein QBC45DRAFT_323260, partial [Copromyces sp. CBS 386.78]